MHTIKFFVYKIDWVKHHIQSINLFRSISTINWLRQKIIPLLYLWVQWRFVYYLCFYGLFLAICHLAICAGCIWSIKHRLTTHIVDTSLE
jgi:hypothetical protein